MRHFFFSPITTVYPAKDRADQIWNWYPWQEFQLSRGDEFGTTWHQFQFNKIGLEGLWGTKIVDFHVFVKASIANHSALIFSVCTEPNAALICFSKTTLRKLKYWIYLSINCDE